MLADGEETNSRGGGLGTTGEGREFGPQSTTEQLARQLRRRWKMLASILVTAVTTVAIYRVDGSFSKDATVFAIVTVALLVYTLFTIRTDLRLE